MSASNDAPHQEEFWTVKEVCKYLKLSRNHVYEAIATGKLPGVIRIGNAIRINKATLLGSIVGDI